MAEALIPIKHFEHGFTTCSSLQLLGVAHFDLSDKGLAVHRVTSRTSHRIVRVPNLIAGGLDSLDPPSDAWEAFYPKGSINPSGTIAGGFGFYLSGPPSFSQSLEQGAVEAVSSYRVMFQENWEWVKGGKLPGIYGGVGNSAYGCTGGRQKDRCTCFDVRLMWRSNGVGELYVYAPQTTNNRTRFLNVPPKSLENADYGFSVGRGAFTLQAGRWTSVAIRIRLNGVGHEDGEIQLWVDGKSVISVAGITWRESEESQIKGMHFETFFGGHTEEWACPKDQRAWFADVTGVIVS